MIYLQEIGLERMSLQDLHYAMKMLAPEFIAFIAGIFFLVKIAAFDAKIDEKNSAKFSSDQEPEEKCDEVNHPKLHNHFNKFIYNANNIVLCIGLAIAGAIHPSAVRTIRQFKIFSKILSYFHRKFELKYLKKAI
ncbi:unnamed protein product [Dracunculus medinensis]|uniref:Piezo TM1-24 domain-containing protein n=1 Tax=Dracunculus medinensis TaxID=318479 RepID=A0A0N4UJ51_DRAME|nr:unnamed protein product [Dracunculus medinensis]